MASLPTRTTASFDAIKPVSSLVLLDDELNDMKGATGFLNGGTTGKKLLVKTSDAADPPIECDQVGAGPLAEWKQNGTLKVSINNTGQVVSDVTTGTAPFDVDSTTMVTNLNADTVDGIQGSNIAKLDTSVAAWSYSWFFESVPAAAESLHTEPRNRFIVPTGTAITVTKLRVQFAGGSHTAGGSLLFQVYKVDSDGTNAQQIGQIQIDNGGPAILAVKTQDISDFPLTDGQTVVARLEAKSGTNTEALITVSAIGTQKLT
jgi:hypothetical protein